MSLRGFVHGFLFFLFCFVLRSYLPQHQMQSPGISYLHKSRHLKHFILKVFIAIIDKVLLRVESDYDPIYTLIKKTVLDGPFYSFILTESLLD